MKKISVKSMSMLLAALLIIGNTAAFLPKKGVEALAPDSTDANIENIESTQPTMPEHEVITPHVDSVNDVEVPYDPSLPLFAAADVIPSSYSLVDAGAVTPIKYQFGGTCWAHAAVASSESSLLKSGKVTDSSSLDLSEKHLAYYVYHTAADRLGNTYGDSNTLLNGSNYVDSGGNSWFAMLSLAGWNGSVNEKVSHGVDWHLYSYESYDSDSGSYEYYDNYYDTNKPTSSVSQKQLTYTPSYAYSFDDYTLKDCTIISLEDTDVIKKLLMEKGACTVSIDYDGTYLNSSTGAYYCPSNSCVNHDVTIVGWDDSYPAANFKTNPGSNGAWLIKNSWGTWWGNDGYGWLSYADDALQGHNSVYNDVYFFEVDAAETNGNIYQYDGGFVESSFYYTRSKMYEAAIYTADGSNTTTPGSELLKDISFVTVQPKVNYSVEIYTGLTDTTNPMSGTMVLSAPITGCAEYSGYHTVDIPEDIILDPGDKFSVVITLACVDSSAYLKLPESYSYTYDGWISMTEAVSPGQTFYTYDTTSPGWMDAYNRYNGRHSNLRIKASTVPYVCSSPTSLELNKDSVEISLGETLDLTASVLPKKHSGNIEWSVTDAEGNATGFAAVNILSVADGTARFSATAPGTYIVTAACEGVSDTCTVTVNPVAVSSLALDTHTATVNCGETVSLTAAVLPENRSDAVTWSVTGTNSAYATLSVSKTTDTQASFTASAPGTYDVTAACGPCCDTCIITVLRPATGITISKSTLAINAGDGFRLTAAATPSDTTDTIIWSTDNVHVAAVDSTGYITAVGAGTANITATAGSFSASCAVTVSVPATAVTLSDEQLTLAIGEDAELTATVLPTDTTDSLVWQSSDISVATVTDGCVTAVSAGTAAITATAGSVSAVCNVTVVVPAESVTLSAKSINLTVGSTTALTATVLPANTTDNVVWSTSDATVAAVSGGTVTAVAKGTAVITASAGTQSAKCTVIVSTDHQDYDITPNVNGAASKLYEPWGLRYFAVYDGDDADKITTRGIAILKDTYYDAAMSVEDFCADANAHIFQGDELGLEAASTKYPNGRYYATLTDGIYSYDISAKYYVLPFAVMENGQYEYGTVKSNSMENILNTNLGLSSITSEEKVICTCILELKASVAAHYAASGVPGASAEIVIPRGSSQTAASSVKTTAQAGITPNIVAGASKLIEPWGLRYFSTYDGTGASDIAERGTVILCEKSYDASYATTPDAMRLNADAYVFRTSDNTLAYDGGTARWYATLTEGITSKDISDVYYVVPFVVLNDGSYVYGTVKQNSMMNIMTKNLSIASVKQTEKDVSQDIIDLYNAVKAYYAAK